MLIARCPIEGLVPPREIYAHGAHYIEIETSDLPHAADAWITCVQAMPHIDPSWPRQLFVTLTVAGGGHQLGDAELIRQRKESVLVPPGSLFVVDPMVPHWLIDQEAAIGNHPPARWVGLQWEVPRDRALRRAREIVDLLGGRWINVQDERYADWQVHGRQGP